jgi:hypothetical protein
MEIRQAENEKYGDRKAIRFRANRNIYGKGYTE